MAEHLASIYGTEKDRINCPFYYKIGACRHGTRCSRVHNKPLFSQTILLENLYQTPDQIRNSAKSQNLPDPQIPEEDIRNHFDDFYFDIHGEMRRYGQIEELHVCENLAIHLAGNTYVKFRSEEAAQAALNAMEGRWYAGRPVKAEFSPVTDFKDGKCRPFERFGQCEHGDYCHFMHIRRHAAPLVEEPVAPDPGRRVERRDYERTSRERYSERSSLRDYNPPSEQEKPSWLESDRVRKERGYAPGRASYDDDRRSGEHRNSPSHSRDRGHDRSRYSDYARPHRSSRDRDRRGY